MSLHPVNSLPRSSKWWTTLYSCFEFMGHCNCIIIECGKIHLTTNLCTIGTFLPLLNFSPVKQIVSNWFREPMVAHWLMGTMSTITNYYEWGKQRVTGQQKMNLYKMCTRGGNPLSSPPGSDVHRLYFPLSSSLDDDESMRRLTGRRSTVEWEPCKFRWSCAACARNGGNCCCWHCNWFFDGAHKDDASNWFCCSIRLRCNWSACCAPWGTLDIPALELDWCCKLLNTPSIDGFDCSWTWFCKKLLLASWDWCPVKNGADRVIDIGSEGDGSTFCWVIRRRRSCCCCSLCCSCCAWFSIWGVNPICVCIPKGFCPIVYWRGSCCCCCRCCCCIDWNINWPDPFWFTSWWLSTDVGRLVVLDFRNCWRRSCCCSLICSGTRSRSLADGTSSLVPAAPSLRAVSPWCATDDDEWLVHVPSEWLFVGWSGRRERRCLLFSFRDSPLITYAIAWAALSAASLLESSFHWPVAGHFLRNRPGGVFE